MFFTCLLLVMCGKLVVYDILVDWEGGFPTERYYLYFLVFHYLRGDGFPMIKGDLTLIWNSVVQTIWKSPNDYIFEVHQ